MIVINEKSIKELNQEKQELAEKELTIQGLEEENANLIIKSAMTDMKSEGLENDVAGLMLRVAMIEMGGNL